MYGPSSTLNHLVTKKSIDKYKTSDNFGEIYLHRKLVTYEQPRLICEKCIYWYTES